MLLRAKRPEAIDLMEPWLISEPDENVSDVLRDMLTEAPDDILVGQVWDGEELQGFVIVLAPPAKNFVFIYQAWFAETLPTELMKRLLLMTELWAESLGRDEMRMETLRDTSGLSKLWGFKPLSVVMSSPLRHKEQDNGLHVSATVSG
jgi:hypothetical protein